MHTLDNIGWADCGSNMIMTGMFRSSAGGCGHNLHCIEQFNCARPYGGDVTLTNCNEIDIGARGGGDWVYCPNKQLLNGFYRDGQDDIDGIKKIRCCDFIHTNGRILTVSDPDTEFNWGTCFDDEGWCNVNPLYYLTGFWRSGSCAGIYCIERARGRYSMVVDTNAPSKAPSAITNNPTQSMSFV